MSKFNLQECEIGYEGIRLLLKKLTSILGRWTDDDEYKTISSTRSSYLNNSRRLLAEWVFTELPREISDIPKYRNLTYQEFVSIYETAISSNIDTLKTRFASFRLIRGSHLSDTEQQELFAKKLARTESEIQIFLSKISGAIFLEYDVSPYKLERSMPLKGLNYIAFSKFLDQWIEDLSPECPEIETVKAFKENFIDGHNSLNFTAVEKFLQILPLEEGRRMCRNLNNLIADSFNISNLTLYAGRMGGLDAFKVFIPECVDDVIERRLMLDGYELQTAPNFMAAKLEYESDPENFNKTGPILWAIESRAIAMIPEIREALDEFIKEFLQENRVTCRLADCSAFARKLEIYVSSYTPPEQAAIAILETILTDAFKETLKDPYVKRQTRGDENQYQPYYR